MKKDEKKFMVDNEYMKNIQTEIVETGRAYVLSWIIDVHRKFKLKPEVLYVT